MKLVTLPFFIRFDMTWKIEDIGKSGDFNETPTNGRMFSWRLKPLPPNNLSDKEFMAKRE